MLNAEMLKPNLGNQEGLKNKLTTKEIEMKNATLQILL